MLQPDTYRHQGLRKQLVEVLRQNKTMPDPYTKKMRVVRYGIQNESILNAIGEIPRHLLFDSRDTVLHITQAYEDKAFPILADQTISQPFTVARQTELLEIKPGDKVLEIGTGSGYQALVLMLLQANVYSIERHKILYDRTSALLPQIQSLILSRKPTGSNSAAATPNHPTEFKNIKCFFGDGFEGLPAHAPFDKIIITAATPQVPQKLLAQLAVGGKMVFPLGPEKDCHMNCWTKLSETDFTKEIHEKFAFVPMLAGKVS